MKTRILTVCLVLLAALVLAACDGGSSASTATPGAAAGTPARGVTPGAQRARSTAAAPGAAASPAATATPAASGAAIAPTAVPIPDITVPTAQPARTPAAKAPTVTGADAAPTATPIPVTVPSVAQERTADELRGKIVFFSDRDGGYPQLYIMDADGGNQQPCNCSSALEGIVEQEVASPDGNQFLYVTKVGGGRGGNDYQIWAHRVATNEEAPVTGGAPGFPGVDYDPAWSPNARFIAWVSETNGFDEIYLYDRAENSNTRLTQSGGEWYKHPTFAPDGSQIAYWTNVENAERKQIWAMNLDGSGQHNLSRSNFNDWDPIWVK